MKQVVKKSRKAFTLIEMIIAITVFTIFIGFAISSYLTFHRADQEALVTRGLIMDAESLMDTLSEAIQENKIFYDCDSGVLCLVSPDGENLYTYTWDAEEETVSKLAYDKSGVPLAGYENPVLLHSANVQVSYFNFSIFPGVNPYDPENRGINEVQFQPIVTVDFSIYSKANSREDARVNLHTSITSRFYQ